MDLASVFNPITATSGTFTASTLVTGSTMIVINKSYVDLVISFPNGDNRDVPANDRRSFVFSDASTVGNGQFKWSQQNVDYPQTVLQLQNIVRIEVYSPTEKIAENYPAPLVRETLPNLIPFNVGYGSVSNFGLANNANVTIWGASYPGVAMCPSSSTRGLGYDHFYMYNGFIVGSNTISTVMPDLPATFPSTGKTANDATINTLSAMQFVPGPFSQPGLTPVDTAGKLTLNWWNLAATIPWASSTSGFMIEAWINIPAFPNHNMFIFSQDYPPVNSLGVAVYVDVNGFVQGWLALAGGNKATMSLSPLSLNTWHYVAFQYTGTTTNTINLWIDGVLQATTATSGAPLNSALLPAIGHTTAAVADPGFTGSITNVGICLTPPATIQYQPNSRFIHAQQSLNTDYQNAWVRKIDFTVVNGANAGTVVETININNVLNTSGLMDALTPTNLDPFHVYVPAAVTIPLRIPILAVNQVFPISYDPAGLVGQVSTRFIKINVQNLPTGCTWDLTVHGYNILAVA